MAQHVTEINCIQCNTLLSVEGIEPLCRVACPICNHENLVPLIIANYKIISIIGAGGQGTVYRAVDTSLQRVVAVKLLKVELATDQQFITNFAREARAAAMVTHPYVVQIYSFGEDEGQYYLAMELMEKGNLDERIDKEGRITEIDVLLIGAQIASGLQAAFEKGLIHRDIKPGNILFDDHMQAKLVDFGLATVVGGNTSQEIWGTPYYISPEKLSGGQEDFRSDIYSLGATLFHAIAGRPPFEGEDAAEIVSKHMKSQAVSLHAFAPHVADETAYVINKMLNKNSYERYNSYDELIQHLNYAREQIEHRFQNPLATVKADFKLNDELDKNPYILWGVIGMFVIVVGLIAFVGLNYKKLFGIESPTSEVKPLMVTQSKINAEQQETWDKSNQYLSEGQFAEALEELGRLQAQLPVDPANPISQWIPLQMMAAGYGLADQSKVDALIKTYNAGNEATLPSKVTMPNLTREMIKAVTTRRPVQDENNWILQQNKDIAHMSAYYLAMKALAVSNYDRALELFKLSRTFPVNEGWMKEIDSYGKKFEADSTLFDSIKKKAAAVSDADSAQTVLSEIRSASTKVKFPAFVDALQALEYDLKTKYPAATP
ncbi:MAG: serine/threonine-protein kinase [Verrucomicrobiota bacterium]|nr:serine/threonine-protein kinase [Verrucomicrobiota bacterium]